MLPPGFVEGSEPGVMRGHIDLREPQGALTHGELAVLHMTDNAVVLPWRLLLPDVARCIPGISLLTCVISLR